MSPDGLSLSRNELGFGGSWIVFLGALRALRSKRRAPLRILILRRVELDPQRVRALRPFFSHFEPFGARGGLPLRYLILRRAKRDPARLVPLTCIKLL